MDPIVKLAQWLAEEKAAGNPFSHGAVLGTIGADGQPKTRMLGVHIDGPDYPRFHTSPTTRKVSDISCEQRASVTFAFQNSLRSVTLEGTLEALPYPVLHKDWLSLDQSFRRSYLVFGQHSGEVIDSIDSLKIQRDELPPDAETEMPDSFIGYRFSTLSRVCFYAVGKSEFASSEVYDYEVLAQGWLRSQLVP